MKFQAPATALAVTAAALFAVPAQAGLLEDNSFYLGGMVTHFESSHIREADGEQPGVALYLGGDLKAWPRWSVDLGLAWNELSRDGVPGNDKIYQLGLDLMRQFSVSSAFTPYLVGGLAASLEEVRGESSTQPTLGLGGGLLWQTGLSSLKLRLDARALAQANDYDASDDQVLIDGRFGLGLQWQFLAPAEPAVADGDGDGDGDGVADANDLCPDSAPGAQVDSTGCEALGLTDSDEDGVPDRDDACPGTPQGESVDAEGCSEQPAVELRGVNFEFDSARLTSQAKEILLPIAELLRTSLQGVRIEIAGHTDFVGSDEYNQALSERRAAAVWDFLVENWVDPDRLTTIGYGSTQPVADNKTAEGRARNRRVVFRIIE